MKKIPIVTNAAPPSMGTHNQAILVGNMVYTIGQTGRDPKSGKLLEGLEAQTRQMLANIEAILEAAGCTPADIVKVTLLMKDIKTFKAIDDIYAAWLPDKGVAPLPVRTACEVSALPAGALVMLEAVAVVPH